MKKRMLMLFCSVALFFFAVGAIGANAYGGGHHPEPNYPGWGGSCNLGNNFHNYDYANHYGSGQNVWCNGTNQQLNQHHGGNVVSADLPSGNSFVGGFCMKSRITSGDVLRIQYKDLVEHDKVWLKSGDQAYYPIDKTAGENFILVDDNGWADRNAAVGQVEADVLLSGRSGSGSGSSDGGGGGGCNAVGIGGLLLVTVVPAALRLTRKNRDKK